MVSSFVALAPDWRGTALSTQTGLVPLSPSILQQAVGSNFMKALAAGGGLKALVPTTTSSSLTDEVVVPGPVSARLDGAQNFIAQNECVGKVLTHEGQLFDGFAYSLVKEAFSSPDGAAKKGNKLMCLAAPPGVSPADMLVLAGVSRILCALVQRRTRLLAGWLPSRQNIPGAAAAVVANVGISVLREPKLPAYATGAKRRQLGRMTRNDVVDE